MAARILFLSDTHLGVDLPMRPRRPGRRRGDDFFDAFEHVLAPAFAGACDAVLHGGDLFYRSRIPAPLAERVFARLADLADAGVDLFWVPGNHERSSIPRPLLLTHPRIHVFDHPRTFTLERGGLAVALSGFPFSPTVRDDFGSLLAATGHGDVRADARLLCLHQTVEGAAVGPDGFVFRGGPDVVRGRDVPAGFHAILCGHIHRAQVLRRDFQGRPLAAPVLYPGSTERTSAAERNEAKGSVMLELARGAAGELTAEWEFRAHSPAPGEPPPR